MLADIGYKSCVRLDVIRDDIDRISGKERKAFICVSFSLLELLDLLYPFRILALRNSLYETFREVLDITANTEVNRNVLSDLGTVAVNVDLCSREREFLCLSCRPVRESYAKCDYEICLSKSYRRCLSSVHSLHTQESRRIGRNLG